MCIMCFTIFHLAISPFYVQRNFLMFRKQHATTLWAKWVRMGTDPGRYRGIRQMQMQRIPHKYEPIPDS